MKLSLRAGGGSCLCAYARGPLTERHDNGAGDAVGHDDSEDAQHPSVPGSKLELVGLVLGAGGCEARDPQPPSGEALGPLASPWQILKSVPRAQAGSRYSGLSQGGRMFREASRRGHCTQSYV